MPKTDFRPQTDGFAFPNRWIFTDDPTFGNEMQAIFQNALDNHLEDALYSAFGAMLVVSGIIPRVRQWIEGGDPADYGMCGGMAYAALDYWHRRWLVPRGPQAEPIPNVVPPSADSPLWQPASQATIRRYIRDRLADSLNPEIATKVLLWMAVLHLIDDPIFHAGARWLVNRSHEEFKAVRQHIDQGQPWPIVLIGDRQDPFSNHQVLAYGYEDMGSDAGLMYVYDNNCPNKECIIEMDFAHSVLVIGSQCETCQATVDGSGLLHGFFCSNYKDKRPPIAVGLSAGVNAQGTIATGKLVSFSYSVRNDGYGNTPSMTLSLRGRAGSNLDVVADPPGESTRSQLAEGATRTLATGETLRPPTGRRVYSPAAYLGHAYGVECWKDLPVQDSGTIQNLNVIVGLFELLGERPVSRPAALTQSDGKMRVYVRATGGALYFTNVLSTGGWAPWHCLGHPKPGRGATPSVSATGNPAAICRTDRRGECYLVGSDGAVWRIVESAPNGNWPQQWESLGGQLHGDVTVERNADGRLEVFGRGFDNALWHIWQTSVNGPWSTWNSLGGQLIDCPAVACNADGRLEVFARHTGGAMQHIWQTATNNGWSNWGNMGGPLGGPPVVARNGDGRLEVFARNTQGTLNHIWQVAPNSGWSAWSSMDAAVTGLPVAITDGSGRITVFIVAPDGDLRSCKQTINGWGDWTLIYAAPTVNHVADPAAARDGTGHLHLFFRDNYASVNHLSSEAM